MPDTTLKTVDVSNREEWRAWLAKHHSCETEIWLIFYKPYAAKTSVSYEAAVEEALCFGWVDTLIRRLDDDRYARKFTPRKPNSKWSTSNRRRYADLQARGLLTQAGIERRPTDRDGDAPRPSLSAIPPYIENQLRANPAAQRHFQNLAPSQQRLYIAWIDSAKRQPTKQKRLQEALSLLAAGRKLGMK